MKINLNDPTLSINKPHINKTLIFPNPALNIVTIKSNSTIEKLTLYDMLGKQVYNLSLSNLVFEHSLDISTLNSGVYHLRIKTANGIETQKIIKN
jgi:hypothetical protein